MTRRRVTDEQIRAALKVCGGNVAEVARVLGIARNNVYKRMANKDIRPDKYRPRSEGDGVAETAETHAAHATELADASASGDAASSASVFLSDIFRGSGKVRTFPAVSTESPAVEPDGARGLKLSRTYYLRPDQVRAIDEACLDLPAILREKVSPSRVLEMFLDARLGAWLAEIKCPKPAPAAKAKRKARTEGGAE